MLSILPSLIPTNLIDYGQFSTLEVTLCFHEILMEPVFRTLDVVLPSERVGILPTYLNMIYNQFLENQMTKAWWLR